MAAARSRAAPAGVLAAAAQARTAADRDRAAARTLAAAMAGPAAGRAADAPDALLVRVRVVLLRLPWLVLRVLLAVALRRVLRRLSPILAVRHFWSPRAK